VLNGNKADSEGPGEELGEAKPAPTARAAARKKELVELFNIVTDPSEKTNLAEKEPEKLKELKAAYEAVAKEAVAPKQAPAPKGFTVAEGLGGGVSRVARPSVEDATRRAEGRRKSGEELSFA